jgi:hypothetical protein
MTKAKTMIHKYNRKELCIADPSSQFLCSVPPSIFLVALLVVQSGLTTFFCRNIGTISCFFLHIQNFHKRDQICNFCNETKETILYLFWECNIVKSLWLEMAEILKNKSNV